MENNRHSIQRLAIEVTRRDGVEDQTLYESVRSVLLREIEAALDQICGPHQVLRLDQLVVEVPPIPVDRYPAEFPPAFRESLQKSLGRAKEEELAGSAVASGEPTNPEFRALTEFLRTGRFPWWHRPQTGESVEKLFAAAQEKATEALARWLRAHGKSSPIIARLSQNLPETQLHRVMQGVFTGVPPFHFTAIRGLVKYLRYRRKSTPLTAILGQIYRGLAELLNTGAIPPDPAQFLRELLPHLAEAEQTAVLHLRSTSEKAAGEAPAVEVAAAGLSPVQADWLQTAVAGTTLKPEEARGRKPNPRRTTRQSEREVAQYYLRYGSLPPWAARYRPEEVQQVVLQQLQSKNAQFRLHWLRALEIPAFQAHLRPVLLEHLRQMLGRVPAQPLLDRIAAYPVAVREATALKPIFASLLAVTSFFLADENRAFAGGEIGERFIARISHAIQGLNQTERLAIAAAIDRRAIPQAVQVSLRKALEAPVPPPLRTNPAFVPTAGGPSILAPEAPSESRAEQVAPLQSPHHSSKDTESDAPIPETDAHAPFAPETESPFESALPATLGQPPGSEDNSGSSPPYPAREASHPRNLSQEYSFEKGVFPPADDSFSLPRTVTTEGLRDREAGRLRRATGMNSDRQLPFSAEHRSNGPPPTSPSAASSSIGEETMAARLRRHPTPAAHPPQFWQDLLRHYLVTRTWPWWGEAAVAELRQINRGRRYPGAHRDLLLVISRVTMERPEAVSKMLAAMLTERDFRERLLHTLPRMGIEMLMRVFWGRAHAALPRQIDALIAFFNRAFGAGLSPERAWLASAERLWDAAVWRSIAPNLGPFWRIFGYWGHKLGRTWPELQAQMLRQSESVGHFPALPQPAEIEALFTRLPARAAQRDRDGQQRDAAAPFSPAQLQTWLVEYLQRGAFPPPAAAIPLRIFRAWFIAEISNKNPGQVRACLRLLLESANSAGLGLRRILSIISPAELWSWLEEAIQERGESAGEALALLRVLRAELEKWAPVRVLDLLLAVAARWLTRSKGTFGVSFVTWLVEWMKKNWIEGLARLVLAGQLPPERLPGNEGRMRWRPSDSGTWAAVAATMEASLRLGRLPDWSPFAGEDDLEKHWWAQLRRDKSRAEATLHRWIGQGELPRRLMRAWEKLAVEQLGTAESSPTAVHSAMAAAFLGEKGFLTRLLASLGDSGTGAAGELSGQGADFPNNAFGKLGDAPMSADRDSEQKLTWLRQYLVSGYRPKVTWGMGSASTSGDSEQLLQTVLNELRGQHRLALREVVHAAIWRGSGWSRIVLVGEETAILALLGAGGEASWIAEARQLRKLVEFLNAKFTWGLDEENAWRRSLADYFVARTRNKSAPQAELFWGVALFWLARVKGDFAVIVRELWEDPVWPRAWPDPPQEARLAQMLAAARRGSTEDLPSVDFRNWESDPDIRAFWLGEYQRRGTLPLDAPGGLDEWVRSESSNRTDEEVKLTSEISAQVEDTSLLGAELEGRNSAGDWEVRERGVLWETDALDDLTRVYLSEGVFPRAAFGVPQAVVLRHLRRVFAEASAREWPEKLRVFISTKSELPDALPRLVAALGPEVDLDRLGAIVAELGTDWAEVAAIVRVLSGSKLRVMKAGRQKVGEMLLRQWWESGGTPPGPDARLWFWGALRRQLPAVAALLEIAPESAHLIVPAGSASAGAKRPESPRATGTKRDETTAFVAVMDTLYAYLRLGFLPDWSEWKEPIALSQALRDQLRRQPNRVRLRLHNWVRTGALPPGLVERFLKSMRGATPASGQVSEEIAGREAAVVFWEKRLAEIAARFDLPTAIDSVLREKEAFGGKYPQSLGPRWAARLAVWRSWLSPADWSRFLGELRRAVRGLKMPTVREQASAKDPEAWNRAFWMGRKAARRAIARAEKSSVDPDDAVGKRGKESSAKRITAERDTNRPILSDQGAGESKFRAASHPDLPQTEFADGLSGDIDSTEEGDLTQVEISAPRKDGLEGEMDVSGIPVDHLSRPAAPVEGQGSGANDEPTSDRKNPKGKTSTSPGRPSVLVGALDEILARSQPSVISARAWNEVRVLVQRALPRAGEVPARQRLAAVLYFAGGGHFSEQVKVFRQLWDRARSRRGNAELSPDQRTLAALLRWTSDEVERGLPADRVVEARLRQAFSKAIAKSDFRDLILAVEVLQLVYRHGDGKLRRAWAQIAPRIEGAAAGTWGSAMVTAVVKSILSEKDKSKAASPQLRNAIPTEIARAMRFLPAKLEDWEAVLERKGNSAPGYAQKRNDSADTLVGITGPEAREKGHVNPEISEAKARRLARELTEAVREDVAALERIQDLPAEKAERLARLEKEKAEYLRTRKQWGSEGDDAEKLYIENAGLVIAHPFLPRFFGHLGLLDQKEFVDSEAQERAILLMQYLVDGRTEAPEHRLTLNKILVGWPPHAPIEPGRPLTEEEQKHADDLLQAIKGFCKPLKNTSVSGMQRSFFQREGILVRKGKNWNLKVEKRTEDILLKQFTYGIGMVNLPFNDFFLYVEWI